MNNLLINPVTGILLILLIIWILNKKVLPVFMNDPNAAFYIGSQPFYLIDLPGKKYGLKPLNEYSDEQIALWNTPKFFMDSIEWDGFPKKFFEN